MFRTTQGRTVLLTGGLWLLTVGAAAQGVHARVTATPNSLQVSAKASLPSALTLPLAVLNQLTIGDLVTGFQQSRGQAGQLGQAGQAVQTGQVAQTPTAGTQASLAPQQQQLIQGLQSQLDGQEINEETFASKLHGVLGNAASSRGFGVLGAPLSQPPAEGTPDPLNLTAEQQQFAQDISTRLHDDIAALRQNSHELIFSVLTPEQQAQLNASTAGQAAQPAQSSTAQTRLEGKGLRSAETNVGAAGSGTNAGAQTTAAVAAQDAGSDAPWQNPLDSLQLTDTQKAEIELIRSDLRVAVQARHQQARDEFFAILTPEQQAALYTLEQTSSTTASADGQ